MKMVDPILAEMDQEGTTTRRVLERVPEDKLTWKPHEKSMSLGRLAMHVAEITGNIAEMGEGDSFDFGTRPPGVGAEAKSQEQDVAAHRLPPRDVTVGPAGSRPPGLPVSPSPSAR